MTRASIAVGVLATLFLYHVRCLAYQIGTHYDLSVEAVNRSVLAKPRFLEGLGLKPLAAKQQFSTTLGANGQLLQNVAPACTYAQKESVARLIACGAIFEDTGTRPLNHFFDPTHNGRALTLPGIGLLDHWPSPDWALEDSPIVGVVSQEFSYAKARRYFFGALTLSSANERDVAWGKMFQSIGQIVHHLQDMAQPQHVRNDTHLDALEVGLGPYNHPSRYERYSGRSDVARSLRQLVQQQTPPPVFPAYATTFTLPRALWTAGGKGIAEFTNRNFLSVRTNFIYGPQGAAANPNYALPAPGLARDVAIADLFASIPVPQSVDDACRQPNLSPIAYLADCYMTFYESTVTDHLTGLPSVNPRASTYSIFDEDLEVNNATVPVIDYTNAMQTAKIFALNRFNFDAAHPYLLPRAVAYSAGLINYFFRGQMEIAPPEEGVYAISDHNNCGTPCGFWKLKLKVKNTTGNNEPINFGALRAVVKFYRNLCYQANLSGDFGGPNFVIAGNSNACRAKEEEIVVSDPLPVASPVATTDPVPTLTFIFGTPIPISASDFVLQVVFIGQVGQEANAVAVATKDISEPNFYALENFTDYVYDPGLQQYFPHPYKGYASPVDVSNIRVAFGSNSAMTRATAIATLDRLSGGQHAQFAVLMERGQALFSEEWDSFGAQGYDSPGEQGPFDVQEFTMDDTGPYAGQYTKTCPVHVIRGIYRQYDAFFVQQVVAHRGGAVGLKEVTVVSSSKATPTEAGVAKPKTAVAPNCGTLPTDGYYNFSGIPSLGPGNAVQWQINF